MSEHFTTQNIQSSSHIITYNPVQENAPPDVILMLLGNKNDCAHREVQLKEGEDLSKVK